MDFTNAVSGEWSELFFIIKMFLLSALSSSRVTTNCFLICLSANCRVSFRKKSRWTIFFAKSRILSWNENLLRVFRPRQADVVYLLFNHNKKYYSRIGTSAQGTHFRPIIGKDFPNRGLECNTIGLILWIECHKMVLNYKLDMSSLCCYLWLFSAKISCYILLGFKQVNLA